MSWKVFDQYGRLQISNNGGMCAPVTIVDQITGLTIATVASGGIYPVLQFSGIQDDGPPYTNSIIPA